MDSSAYFQIDRIPIAKSQFPDEVREPSGYVLRRPASGTNVVVFTRGTLESVVEYQPAPPSPAKFKIANCDLENGPCGRTTSPHAFTQSGAKLMAISALPLHSRYAD